MLRIAFKLGNLSGSLIDIGKQPQPDSQLKQIVGTNW